MNNRVILTDCDGVLCNWDKGFDTFARSKGLSMSQGSEQHYSIALRYGITHQEAHELVSVFNISSHIANLKPVADSQEYVSKLVDKGFTFIVVTALGDSPLSKLYRASNLEKLYGNVFSDIICISMNTSKYDTLGRWSGSGYFWLEDHMRQAEAGYEQGLKPILFSKPYNRHYSTDLFPTVSEVSPWKDLYQIIERQYNW